MKPLSQPVTTLCLLQLFVIACGFLLTRVFVRAWDKMWGDIGALDPASFAVPRFIAAQGLWFLVVPLVWCSIVVLSAQRSQGQGSPSRPVLILGLLLTLVLAAVFSWAVIGSIMTGGHS
jgi:hypothetical protein